MAATGQVRGRAQGRPPSPPKARTVQYREWKGVNLTDARVAIDDNELAWLENAITIGKGAIQILPAPAAPVASIAAGIVSLWGFVLAGVPVMISVNADGSMSQITPGGAVTAVAPAATVTAAADLSIWQTSPILIVDPSTGYHKWDGTTFTTIDASKTGVSVAVFEGRAWIAKNRTVLYTAPATFDNFTAGDGAGSTIVTDEAFVGNIAHIISVVEQLWLLSASSVEAIANVQATGTSPNVTTSFSVTNIASGLGCGASPHSTIGYFRALTFKAPFGVYALSGVTPQKLSDKLDGMFEAITGTIDAPAATAVVRSLLVLALLVEYTQARDQSLPTPASGSNGATKLLICFSQGKWFFGQQGALVWITTVVVNGVSQAWGTDGQRVFQLFGAAATTPVTYKIQSKLYDFGLSTTNKKIDKFGLEVQAATAIAPTLTIDSERTAPTQAIALTNTLTFVGTGPITFVGTGPITFLTTGMVLGRSNATMDGQFLGWTLTGTDPPYRLQAIQMEIIPTREWNTN